MEMVKFFKNKVFIDIVGITCVVILLSYQAGKLLNIMLAKKSTISIPAKKDVQQGERALPQYAVFVEQNPFGIKGVKFSIIEKTEQKAATYDPQALQLKGVITLPPGYAFIENKDKVQKLFKRGEDVFGYGFITIIEAKKVTISKNGKMFTLTLVGHEEETGKEGDRTKQNKQNKDFIKEYNFAKEEIKRFMEDPKEILTDARLLPNLQQGRQEGFIVREVRPGGLYERLGIMNGDVILRVNKMELTSPNDGAKIITLLKELDRLELDLLRDGKPVTLVYNIN